MELTIPIFDAGAANVAGRNPTIVEVQFSGSGPRFIRNCGAGKAYWSRSESTAGLKGMPLGVNAADNELGEGFTVDGSSVGSLYFSAAAETTLRIEIL